MGQYEQIAEKIKEADGILIGASNGLSIAEVNEDGNIENGECSGRCKTAL